MCCICAVIRTDLSGVSAALNCAELDRFSILHRERCRICRDYVAYPTITMCLLLIIDLLKRCFKLCDSPTIEIMNPMTACLLMNTN